MKRALGVQLEGQSLEGVIEEMKHGKKRQTVRVDDDCERHTSNRGQD